MGRGRFLPGLLTTDKISARAGRDLRPARSFASGRGPEPPVRELAGAAPLCRRAAESQQWPQPQLLFDPTVRRRLVAREQMSSRFVLSVFTSVHSDIVGAVACLVDLSFLQDAQQAKTRERQ